MSTKTGPPRSGNTDTKNPGTKSTGATGAAARSAVEGRPAPAKPVRAARRTAAAQTAPVRVTRSAPPRAPFVLLVLGLLGGALVSLLLLNIVLAEDAMTLTELQRDNKRLNQQRQALQEEIAREESPTVLARRAKALGMVQPTRPAFLDAPTGRVVGPRVRPVPHAAAASAGAARVVAVPGAVVPGDGIVGWGEPDRPGVPEGGRR